MKVTINMCGNKDGFPSASYASGALTLYHSCANSDALDTCLPVLGGSRREQSKNHLQISLFRVPLENKKSAWYSRGLFTFSNGVY
jgi:hypothetical protein